MEEAGVSARRRALVSDAYEQSCFYVRDGEGVAFPVLGSGPGQQHGDVAFMSRIMMLAQERLLDLGVSSRIPAWHSSSSSLFIGGSASPYQARHGGCYL
eukprot:7758584-Pyramimonas_sp.AAC.1